MTAIDAANGVRYSCTSQDCRQKAKKHHKDRGQKPPKVEIGQPCPYCGAKVE